MCKTLICALLLTSYLKSINGETCPYSAPLTVIADETEYGEWLSFTFRLNETKWNLYNKHGKNDINLGTTSKSSTYIHPVNIESLPISYYVSAMVNNSLQQCDLKLAIVFTNNSSGTSSVTRAIDDLKSNPCVHIKSLPCKNEPTLSISYSGIEDESASSVHTITYSKAMLIRCNGPSDNYFKWYYANDTEKVKGPAVTVTKSMDGASIYCAEIATCVYGAVIENCTLARSKVYTLNFVTKDERNVNLPDRSIETGDRDYSDNNVTTHEFSFSGYNAYLKCDGARDTDYVSWYYAPIENEPSPSTAATPASVCPRLSTHSTIENIPYKEDRLLNLYILGRYKPYNEGNAVSLQGDESVIILCAQDESQNARINIHYKKRGEANFKCVDDKRINATNIYDEIVCVNIGTDGVPLHRSAFVLIFNTTVTPATSTSEIYDPTKTSLPEGTTSLPEGTTSLALDDTEGGPRKEQPAPGVWAAIVVSAVLVLAALAYAIYKWRQHTAKRRSNLVLDDQIYSTSGQVQYAELRMKSGSKRIQLQEENSPYAQIIGVMAPRS